MYIVKVCKKLHGYWLLFISQSKKFTSITSYIYIYIRILIKKFKYKRSIVFTVYTLFTFFNLLYTAETSQTKYT